MDANEPIVDEPDHNSDDEGPSEGDETTVWDDVGHVLSSDHRTIILAVLSDDGPFTPSDLGDVIDMETSHVSRSITKLRERDLVELLVPEERRKGRIYGTTDRGDQVRQHIGKE